SLVSLGMRCYPRPCAVSRLPSPAVLPKHRRTYLEGHLDDPVRRETGAAGVLSDGLGIRSVVLAVDLPLGVGHITPDPHHSRHFGNHRIGQPPGGIQFFAGEGGHGSFDDVAGHSSLRLKWAPTERPGYFLAGRRQFLVSQFVRDTG